MITSIKDYLQFWGRSLDIFFYFQFSNLFQECIFLLEIMKEKNVEMALELN